MFKTWYLYVYRYMCIYIYMHATYVYIYICIHIYIIIYIHASLRAYTHTHIYIYVCTCIYRYPSLSLYLCSKFHTAKIKRTSLLAISMITDVTEMVVKRERKRRRTGWFLKWFAHFQHGHVSWRPEMTQHIDVCYRILAEGSRRTAHVANFQNSLEPPRRSLWDGKE